MKHLRLLFKRLRMLIGLVAALVFFLTVLLPPLLGQLTRQQILDRINALPDSRLAELGILSFSAETIRTGWFSSEVHMIARSRLFSVDGRTPATRHGILHINHGPVIWHLSDSLLALADIQLVPLDPDADPAQHFAGSAIVKMTPSLAIEFRAIAGLQAAGGDHWLEWQKNSPLAPVLGLPGSDTASQQLWFDLDREALTAAGLGDFIARWQATKHARVSNNRLLFYIGPQ